MSWCDNCFAPGRCCSRISINSGSWMHGASEIELYIRLAEMTARHLGDPGSIENTGPLMPLWRTPDGRWVFWCPALTREGRCGEYETRPGMCRTFEPGQDLLCVFGTTFQWAVKKEPLKLKEMLEDPAAFGYEPSAFAQNVTSLLSEPADASCAAGPDPAIPTT
jgi:Fe-S-cluster containining protein